LRLFYNIVKDSWNLRSYLNLYRYEINVLHKPLINFIPPVFVVMVSDNCNLRCPTCLYLLENPKKFFDSFISLENFSKVLFKYNKNKKARILWLDGGEPLLHPDLDQLISICKEYNLNPRVSTNGIFIKSKLTSLAKLDYVNVSVDAYDYDSYKKYRGGTAEQFSLIMEGLRALKESHIYFSISFLLSTENLDKIEKMMRLVEHIKPNFVIFHNINPHGNELYKPLTLQDKNTKIFLEKIISRRNYPFDISLPVIFDTDSTLFLNAKCKQPWFYFFFNTIGEVAYCCHLPHDAKIGNVFQDYNFNSTKMTEFRMDIIEGKILKSCLYCQRRFMGMEFAYFNAKIKKWLFNNYINSI